MRTPAYITVTAPPGRVTPIHRDDGVDLGGGQLTVSAGEIVRVRYAKSQSIRRRIAAGDLVPCDMNGAAVGVDLAAAPRELDGGKVLARREAKPGKAES